MTATLHPTRRADRATTRPIGRTHMTVRGRADAVASTVDYTSRRVAAAVVAVVVVALVAMSAPAIVGALVDVGGSAVAASELGSASRAAPIVRVHVAQSGDTLWSIADRYRGEIGHDRFVDALIDVNGGTEIQIGQAVRLP